MSQPRELPQSEYDAATAALLASLDTPIDQGSFYAVWLLHQAADAAREHQRREALDHFSLTWTQFEVLWNIWIFGERDAGWVARAAMISKSGLTTVLSQLDRRGLISRQSDPADGRKALVRLSEAGQSLMHEVFARVNESETSFSKPLTTADKRLLVSLLRVLVADEARGSSSADA